MAVSALPRTRAHTPSHTAVVAPAVLFLTLAAPTIDLLSMVLPGALVPLLGVVAISAASAALLLTWVRFPRASWVAAAALAGTASLALRLIGADGAPVLSLLSVIALGIGGAFASPSQEPEAWLA
ncbi:MAG TPA: hypothetical protein VGQ62_13355 [Chloroflexota bacterium]|nr:hypothetical protein [Chloroflexota bacterium]